MSDRIDKLLNLEVEVRRLERQKYSAEGELERIKKEKVSFQRKVDNEIKLSKQEANSEITGKEQEFKKRETELDKREKQIVLREDEQKSIEQDWVKLREEKKKLSQEKKATEEARVNYLEKTHLTELRMKQLEKTLQELGGKTEEPEKARKKK